VSSSLYRTADLLPLLESLPYRNPNTLEDVMAARAGEFRERLPHLACYEQSVAVSVPANLVQEAWVNRANGRPELSAASLAGEFSKGRRLDVSHYRGHVARAAHEELPFIFTQRADVPTVSVVIPCYNQAGLLPDAVESVIAQTYTDWEIVIVDDGSPDGTSQVAQELSRRHPAARIHVVRQANAGLARARNAGIERARGAYILPLDADDRIAPTMLERTHGLLEEQSGVAIAYADLRRFGDDDTIVRTREFNRTILPSVNFFSYCSLYRREVWEAVGGYNPNMAYGYEDWDFWVGASEHGYVARRIPEPLVEYRVRSGSMISNARAHDAELRGQMRRNHPSAYRWDRRLRRWPVVKAMFLKSRIAMAVNGRRGKSV
jgi:glycosyltransferase involved in cell wall biosynthesis